MYGFIYETINLINHRKYIGKCEYSRKNGWENYLGSGVAITKAIEKYGANNFKRTILCECETKEELLLKEKEYIKKFDACNSEEYYNIAEGGEGGNTRLGMSQEDYEEYCKKCSRIGEDNGMFGKQHSSESKLKIGEKTKERFMDEEFKKDFSNKVKNAMSKLEGTPRVCKCCGKTFYHYMKKAKYCKECKEKYTERELYKISKQNDKV